MRSGACRPASLFHIVATENTEDLSMTPIEKNESAADKEMNVYGIPALIHYSRKVMFESPGVIIFIWPARSVFLWSRMGQLRIKR